MYSLLTGKVEDTTPSRHGENALVEGQWTSEAYLAAMRRNLYAASKPGADKPSLLLAANTLALAAQAAWPGPATRTTPRDGDTV